MFCDIDKDTYLMDVVKLRQLLVENPKGTFKGIIRSILRVIPEFRRVKEIADEYGLWILEDACHAPGGYFVDRSGERQYCGNGRFANAGVFFPFIR